MYVSLCHYKDRVVCMYSVFVTCVTIKTELYVCIKYVSI